MPWYPGYNAQGVKVFGDPVGMAKGMWTQPPTVTTPGTTASGSAVVNSTGFDCMVYASAATTMGKIVINNSGTVPGTVVAGACCPPVYLPAGQSIAITYTGALTWTWLAV